MQALFLGFFVGSVGAPAIVAAQAPAPGNVARLAPLRHIERVGVLVEDLTPDAERLALTREGIQADAELELRRAGLPINPEVLTPPTLYFQISVLCGATGTCAVDVSSAVIQDVYLVPASNQAFKAKIWYTGHILLAPKAFVQARVREVVRDQANALATDVLAARAP